VKISDYLDQTELKRVLQGFMVFVVVILIFGVFAMLVVPGLRNANQPKMPPPIEGPSAETGWLDPTEAPPSKGYEKPPVDPRTLMDPTPELLAKGKVLFTKNCAQCHGAEGHGDGMAGAGLKPPVRNFTRFEEQEGPGKWKNGPTRYGIFKTLTEGSPNSSMAAWSQLSPTNRMALVHHVLSLAAFARPPEDPAKVAEFSASLAKAAEKIPNKIPVSLAIKKLAAEAAAPAPLALPVAGDPSPGAALLRRVVVDPGRASQTLGQSQKWKSGIVELAAVVAPGAPGNGFAVSVNTLDRNEWQALLAELSRRVGGQ
jgi:mono/diheme cytochrome c family protein